MTYAGKRLLRNAAVLCGVDFSLVGFYLAEVALLS